MKTIRQQRYSGVIVCRQVTHTHRAHACLHPDFTACMHVWMCVLLAFDCVCMCVSDEDPSGPSTVCPERLHWKSTLPASCGKRKCYRRCPLIAGYTGHAEGGRQGGREGKRRRSWRVVKQARQRERTNEADMAVSSSFVFFLVSDEEEENRLVEHLR